MIINDTRFSREVIDETLVNGFSNIDYMGNYCFYFHILAQCKIVLTDKVNIAAVNFKDTKYNLFINPDNFDKYPLEQRLGILKHEMLHIIYGHIFRFPNQDDIDSNKANIACDCAINQEINPKHLPNGAIYPKSIEDNFKKKGINIVIPENLNAEQYYDLLIENEEDKGNSDNTKDKDNTNSSDTDNTDNTNDIDGGECPESIEDKSSGTSEVPDSNNLSKEQSKEQFEGNSSSRPKDIYEDLWDEENDNHNMWGDCGEGEENETNEEIKRVATKRLIENAAEKSRGNLPNNISEFITIWNKKPKVSWKKVLKNLASNKSIKKRNTIMKRSRRFPDRSDIYGYTRDKEFTICVVLDVSGSMSNDEIENGLIEIEDIAKLTSSDIKIIQVDVEVQEISVFNSKEDFHRSSNGGTEILPGPKWIKEKKIRCDSIVVISDMYIESLEYWKKALLDKDIPNVPYIFLGTDNREPKGLEEFNIGKFFNITDI